MTERSARRLECWSIGTYHSIAPTLQYSKAEEFAGYQRFGASAEPGPSRGGRDDVAEYHQQKYSFAQGPHGVYWGRKRCILIPKKRILITSVSVVAVIAIVMGVAAFKGLRLWGLAHDTRAQIRYLIENGGTIGTVPAADTFSADYLRTIFGDTPSLLDQLKAVVAQGLAEDPALNLGEVAALVVTHRKTESGEVEDVVAHVIGGFPLDKRKPGMHRDGYLRHLTDPQLWNWGNTLVGFLGRDMVLFAPNDEIFEEQSMLIESTLSGQILPLAESLDKPLYFTAVLPNPKRVLPTQLKGHVQAIVLRGYLGKYEGDLKTLILTPSPASSRYATAIMSDIKTAMIVGLKTRWKGVVQDTPWGPQVDPWWSYELVQILEKSELEREEGIVRLSSEFDRIGVNIVLKGLERMGRDLAAMKKTLDDQQDPRVFDAEYRARKPLHYWSEEHRWGPNWPIAPPDSNVVTGTASPDEMASATIDDEF